MTMTVEKPLPYDSLRKAAKLVILEEPAINVTTLQLRLRCGFNRASCLLTEET